MRERIHEPQSAEAAVQETPGRRLPTAPAAVLELQRSAGNHAVTALLREPAPAAAGSAAETKKEGAADAKPAGPSEEDKKEFELFKGDITDATVEAYLERRRKVFGDKEGSDEQYKKYAETADKEFDGIKNLIGQAEDSMDRRKVLYRWLRKAYEDEGIKDVPATVKAGMSPEMKKKIDAVKDKLGGRKAGGFAARPQKLEGDYRLGTLSEHGTGKAVDIAPAKNPQLPSDEWSFIVKFAGVAAPDVSKKKWKDSPKDVWKGVNDLNEAFKKKLKADVDAAVKPADAKPAEAAKADAGTSTTPAASTGVAKADAKPPTREEAIKKLLKGNQVLLACVNDNGEDHGFFELPEDLVVALHGQDLVWGVTFSNVDLHHFEME